MFGPEGPRKIYRPSGPEKKYVGPKGPRKKSRLFIGPEGPEEKYLGLRVSRKDPGPKGPRKTNQEGLKKNKSFTEIQ